MPNYCLFQDIATQYSLGFGVKWVKLYYLDIHDETSPQPRQLNSIVESEANKAWERF